MDYGFESPVSWSLPAVCEAGHLPSGRVCGCIRFVLRKHPGGNLHLVSIRSPCSSRCCLRSSGVCWPEKTVQQGPEPAIRTRKAHDAACFLFGKSCAFHKSLCGPTSYVEISSCHKCACFLPSTQFTRQMSWGHFTGRGSSLWIPCKWTVCVKCVLELTFTNVVPSFRKHLCPVGGFAYLRCVNYVYFRKGVIQRDSRLWGEERGPEAGHHRRGRGGPSEVHDRVPRLLPGLRFHGSPGRSKAASACEPGALRERVFAE